MQLVNDAQFLNTTLLLLLLAAAGATGMFTTNVVHSEVRMHCYSHINVTLTLKFF